MKFNLAGLCNESTVALYQWRLNEKLKTISYSNGINTYNEVVKSINDAAFEALGEVNSKKRRNKNDWWSGDIGELVNEKKKAYKVADVK